MVHLPVNHFDCYLVHAPTSSLETPPDSAAQDSPIYNIPLGPLRLYFQYSEVILSCNHEYERCNVLADDAGDLDADGDGRRYYFCLPMLPSLMQHFCDSDRRSTKWSSGGSSRPLFLGSGNSTENQNNSSTVRRGYYTDIESVPPKPYHGAVGSKAVRVQTDMQVNWDSASS
ncbi:hypothetical protein BDV40DRAFT_301940 [Aspergillus tamarii]|uniref:Uncharacterized protein n=1 Tax=Aspergillus tamarii TaxID=41984 RepID=A0A5N6UQB6_ASPTM|nr:hypothetical protein BDV40DRAFT_301940 [Aspergillus tamarii]